MLPGIASLLWCFDQWPSKKKDQYDALPRHLGHLIGAFEPGFDSRCFWLKLIADGVYGAQVVNFAGIALAGTATMLEPLGVRLGVSANINRRA